MTQEAALIHDRVRRLLPDGCGFIEDSSSKYVAIPNYRGETARALHLREGSTVYFSANGDQVSQLIILP